MRGEYDNNLKWPFKGEVRVQLLNQRGDKRHFERKLLNLSTCTEGDFDRKIVAQVVGRERAERGRGHPQFIANTKLGYNPAEDCQVFHEGMSQQHSKKECVVLTCTHGLLCPIK